MSEAENRALFERYFDQVANKDNLDLADEIFATDYQHHDPANPDPRPMIGAQAVKDHLTSLKSAFPDLIFDIDDIVAEGDSIVVRWTARGTNTGDYRRGGATNKHGTMRAFLLWRLTGGRLAESWGMADRFQFLQQLGFVPSDDELAARPPKRD